MFIKNNKENQKIGLKIQKLYQKDNLLLTNSFVEMASEYHINNLLEEKMDFQDRKTSYNNRIFEYGIKKQYNPVIVNLYNNGLLIIDNIEYKLKDFFIVFNDNKNDFYLISSDNRYNNKELDYNKAVKFIDTTAFINLINNSNIQNNKIIIKDKDILINIVNEWNGYLHDQTKETDAIINKKMIKDDVNE